MSTSHTRKQANFSGWNSLSMEPIKGQCDWEEDDELSFKTRKTSLPAGLSSVMTEFGAETDAACPVLVKPLGRSLAKVWNEFASRLSQLLPSQLRAVRGAPLSPLLLLLNAEHGADFGKGWLGWRGHWWRRGEGTAAAFGPCCCLGRCLRGSAHKALSFLEVRKKEKLSFVSLRRQNGSLIPLTHVFSHAHTIF